MKQETIYVYEVIIPLKDYGYNKKIGDLMTLKEIQNLPPVYRNYVKELQSPVIVK